MMTTTTQQKCQTNNIVVNIGGFSTDFSSRLFWHPFALWCALHNRMCACVPLDSHEWNACVRVSMDNVCSRFDSLHTNERTKRTTKTLCAIKNEKKKNNFACISLELGDDDDRRHHTPTKWKTGDDKRWQRAKNALIAVFLHRKITTTTVMTTCVYHFGLFCHCTRFYSSNIHKYINIYMCARIWSKSQPILTKNRLFWLMLYIRLVPDSIIVGSTLRLLGSLDSNAQNS